MTERIVATEAVKRQIEAELKAYRVHHDQYVREQHLDLSFVTLEALAHDARYAMLVSQPLLQEACSLLVQRLSIYGNTSMLDLTRVWVGIQAQSGSEFFGGFYHENQGYRYFQQVAITSLTGALSCCPVDRILATLELIRAYVHDTLHHNSYRLFFPLPHGGSPGQSFYRFQYGINFRKWNGKSYSAKDPIRSTTTRNLGNIMEAATDRFAHEFVSSIADKIGYTAPSTPTENWIYRDCTGQLTPADMLHLREIERGTASIDATPAFQTYLKNLRLFVQYVTMRYRCFLAEFDPQEQHGLHQLILEGMLSGKLKRLCQCLDTICEGKQSFACLFKSPHYGGDDLCSTRFN
jgi:hypothetical protein